MGNYQDSYTHVLALLQQDIRELKARLGDTEDPSLMGELRGLEWAVEHLEINQPVNNNDTE